MSSAGATKAARTRRAITTAADDLLIQLRSVLAAHSHENGCCKEAQALVESLPVPP